MTNHRDDPNLIITRGTPDGAEPASYDDIHQAVAERFTYKQWTPEQVERSKHITAAAIRLAEEIILNAPPGPMRTRAVNAVEEARMLANAAITHGGRF